MKKQTTNGCGAKCRVAAFAAMFAAAAHATPTATGVAFTENDSTVTVTYSLTESPAIVTLDLQTNVAEGVWASIGGEAVTRGIGPGSEAFKMVSGAGPHAIVWEASRAWPDNNQAAGKIRAVVTAWSPDSPPDYMVVDLAASADADRRRFYPDEGFVPGGVLANERYRRTALLMRRIHARNVTFTMGSVGEYGRNADNEKTCPATLTNDYYLAVFETTQGQWATLTGGGQPSYWGVAQFQHETSQYADMRPVEQVSYRQIRSGDPWSADHEFPNPPADGTFLGRLNSLTGIDFDLPGEAQWEFACRAGCGEGTWNDGTPYDWLGNNTETATNSLAIGRTAQNVSGDAEDFTLSNGTAICGTYAPSLWGLYDMHGNVSEWCLDWFQARSAAVAALDYRVNIDPENPANRLSDGEDCHSGPKVIRGGNYAYNTERSRSADRSIKEWVGQTTKYIGFRVICPVEMR